ncbi:hypothetical protein B6S12_08700 [Helicobacter valdiviensis]|uniref:Uncharacterized protein n=1 Tax=Helicobacter valdiviensis TaxID=1458358 RepID=A0A2W6MSG2_9HELI|nr:hypothetical protein [Helicobacter valdiviensis]PZT47505.1 hypothetical protein B6S12_08700 [Helicobacter valdiviensis]
MKKVSQIMSSKELSHLFQTPKYKSLQAMNRFVLALPFSVRQGILFTYTKNHIMFFVLKHQGFKLEFNYKLTIIKSLLKEYQKTSGELLEIQEIKSFVSNRVQKKVEQEIKKSYGELAKGEFINFAENEEFYAIFERIRECIWKNKEN